MSALQPTRPGRRRSRERTRRSLVRAALAALLAVVAFLLGMAFAQTLDDRPRQGDTVTSVGTLPPLKESERTVTVTVTTP
jgi:hypothetical protein